MTAASRLLPDSTNGSPPYDALDWQRKGNVEVAALWRYAFYPLTSVAGTANAITAATDTTVVAAIAAYVKGMKWSLIPASDNTGAVTLNIDSVGVKSLQDADGNAFVGGELKAGRIYLLEYDGTVVRVMAGGISTSSSGMSAAPDLILRDEKTTGTAGGTATSGAFAKRTLNTVVRNVIAGASLSASQFTLPAGSYLVEWRAPAYRVDGHLSRLFNATDSTTVETGTSESTSSSGSSFNGVTTASCGVAVVTITVAKAFEIDHIVATTAGTTGFGATTNLGAKEVYTEVRVWKLAAADGASSGAAAGTREVLAADRTYYFSTTGSDGNTGRASASSSAVTFTNASSSIGWTGHGKSVGNNFILATGGTLPTNFDATTVYYVKTVVDANTVIASATSGGTAITAGSAGSGAHTATAVASFLTPQHAVNVVLNSVDLGGSAVTLRGANGTYTGAISVPGPFTGYGSVTLLGDATTPGNVLLSTAATAIVAAAKAQINVAGFKIVTSAGGAIQALGGEVTVTGAMEYGAIAGTALQVQRGGQIIINAGYTISGNQGTHWSVAQNSKLIAVALTITLTGTPAFASVFASATRLGSIVCNSNTFSGAATGSRGLASGGALIDTSGAMSNLSLNTYLPGNATATATTQGQFI